MSLGPYAGCVQSSSTCRRGAASLAVAAVAVPPSPPCAPPPLLLLLRVCAARAAWAWACAARGPLARGSRVGMATDNFAGNGRERRRVGGEVDRVHRGEQRSGSGFGCLGGLGGHATPRASPGRDSEGDAQCRADVVECGAAGRLTETGKGRISHQISGWLSASIDPGAFLRRFTSTDRGGVCGQRDVRAARLTDCALCCAKLQAQVEALALCRSFFPLPSKMAKHTRPSPSVRLKTQRVEQTARTKRQAQPP